MKKGDIVVHVGKDYGVGVVVHTYSTVSSEVRVTVNVTTHSSVIIVYDILN